MNKYSIRIEEGNYNRNVLKWEAEVEPDVIDEIVLQIYTILKQSAATIPGELAKPRKKK